MQYRASHKGRSPKRSALQPLYDELRVATPLELSNKFTELDQAMMESGTYDYDNDDLLTNRIKNNLENIDSDLLTEEESSWCNEILWLWYHHAAGMALYGRQDDKTARRFAGKALEHQAEGHPNKITQLLRILADGDIASAEKYVQDKIPEGSVEYDSALEAIETYKEVRLGQSLL